MHNLGFGITHASMTFDVAIVFVLLVVTIVAAHRRRYRYTNHDK